MGIWNAVQLFPFFSSVSIDFRGVEADEILLTHLSQFYRIKRLDVVWNQSLHEQLPAIVENARVHSLNIKNADDDFFPIDRRFESVSEFGFHGPSFSGKRIADLTHFCNVEILDLSYSSFADSNLNKLSTFSALRCLNLDSTKITTEGVGSVSWLNLRSLEDVSADCLLVSGESVKFFVGLNLKSIRLFSHLQDWKTRKPAFQPYFPNCKFVCVVLLPSKRDDPEESFPGDPF